MTIRIFAIAFCLLCLPLLSQTAHSIGLQQPEVVSIGVPTDVLRDYYAFMSGRDPAHVNDYSGPHSRRDVVEVLLTQQALALGGISAIIDFVPVPSYLRLRAEIQEGTIALSGTSMWMTDLVKDKSDFFISDATIADGEFEAGIYVSPNNTRALSATTLERIQLLSAVSSRAWTPDWLTLKSLGLRDLQHVASWKTMVRMVAHERVDFLLAPFQPGQEMLLQVGKLSLTPIRGVKVGLRGSRHLAVSRRTPQCKKIFDALQKGLSILRERGTLKKAYEQSGFYSPNVKDWKRIN